MINGRLQEAKTMNEPGHYDRKHSRFFFEMDGSGNAWPIDAHTHSFMPMQCGCRK